MRFLILAISLLHVFGCAGIRMGYFSRPYIGVEQPNNVAATTFFEQKAMQTVSSGGIVIAINMMNDLQTSDSFWLGVEVPMVPTKVNLKDQWRYAEKGEGHCILLEISTNVAGAEISPKKSILIVDGASANSNHLSRGFYGQINENMVLEVGKKYIFEICYEIKRPTVSQEIQLDLREFIVLPSGQKFPMINFQKQRYRSPYG